MKVKINANTPCKNLENIYVLILISVWAKKLEHWANIDKPLKAIIKLHKEILIISGMFVILETWLQPIVISNSPLIKAEHNSLENPKKDKGK